MNDEMRRALRHALIMVVVLGGLGLFTARCIA